MIAIVIPTKNESGRLILQLKNLLTLASPYPIYVILNGSTDNTFEEVKDLQGISIYSYQQALGYDVPRAVGAYHAYQNGATGVIFIDGDMIGNINSNLLEIAHHLQNGTDLALTNCYPYVAKRNQLVRETIHFRLMLNKELGLYSKIGIASPSHGLVGISKNLMNTIPLWSLAIPPVSLAMAKKANLKIKVATSISHYDLGSKDRHYTHAKKIAHTIMGDCLEARCINFSIPRSRSYNGYTYLGYHPLRRFDLLTKVTTS
ncbi:MAG: glycosyltransferase [Bacillota bacterium]|nr:glycosyltransferase [Bacillota bacterium]